MMDGIIRYTAEDALTQQGMQTLEGPGLWIRAADFDEHKLQVKQREVALQQRLTAADERLDKADDDFALLSLEAGQRIESLEGLLREWRNDVGPRLRDIVDLHKRTDTTLKVSKGGGDDT